MSTLELVLAATLGVWIGVLTLVVFSLVRQLGLMSVRLDRQLYGGQAPVDDGIAVGGKVKEQVARHLVDPLERPEFVLILAGVCGRCQDILREVRDDEFRSPVVALLSGRPESVEILAELMPQAVRIVRDPDALEAIRSLDVVTTPFAFEIREGRVAAKTALRGADHLRRFITEAEGVSTSELRPHLAAPNHGPAEGDTHAAA